MSDEKLTKREDSLYGEITDLHYDLFYKVNNLMGASWDAPTLKKEIGELIHQGFKLMGEIDLMEEKQKKEKEDKRNDITSN